MNDIDPNCLYIRNLPSSVTKEELKAKFDTFGEIESIDLIIHKFYAFVHYVDENSVKKAISELDQKDFKGRKLSLALGYKQRKPESSRSNDSSYYKDDRDRSPPHSYSRMDQSPPPRRDESYRSQPPPRRDEGYRGAPSSPPDYRRRRDDDDLYRDRDRDRRYGPSRDHYRDMRDRDSDRPRDLRDRDNYYRDEYYLQRSSSSRNYNQYDDMPLRGPPQMSRERDRDRPYEYYERDLDRDRDRDWGRPSRDRDLDRDRDRERDRDRDRDIPPLNRSKPQQSQYTDMGSSQRRYEDYPPRRFDDSPPPSTGNGQSQMRRSNYSQPPPPRQYERERDWQPSDRNLGRDRDRDRERDRDRRYPQRDMRDHYRDPRDRDRYDKGPELDDQVDQLQPQSSNQQSNQQNGQQNETDKNKQPDGEERSQYSPVNQRY